MYSNYEKKTEYYLFLEAHEAISDGFKAHSCVFRGWGGGDFRELSFCGPCCYIKEIKNRCTTKRFILNIFLIKDLFFRIFIPEKKMSHAPQFLCALSICLSVLVYLSVCVILFVCLSVYNTCFSVYATLCKILSVLVRMKTWNYWYDFEVFKRENILGSIHFQDMNNFEFVKCLSGIM